jgi:hypothetical protein
MSTGTLIEFINTLAIYTGTFTVLYLYISVHLQSIAVYSLYTLVRFTLFSDSFTVHTSTFTIYIVTVTVLLCRNIYRIHVYLQCIILYIPLNLPVYTQNKHLVSTLPNGESATPAIVLLQLELLPPTLQTRGATHSTNRKQRRWCGTSSNLSESFEKRQVEI